MEEEFLTVKEAAEELGVGERAVRARIACDEIRATRPWPRAKWRIPRSEMDRLLGRADEALREMAAQLKQQLHAPPPDVVLIRDLGGPGTYRGRLEHTSLDILLRDLGHGTGMRASLTTTSCAPREGQDREICWRVSEHGAVEMCYPLEADPSLDSRLLSLEAGVRDRIAAWKMEGGRYLARCSQLLGRIHNDARARLLVGPLQDVISNLPRFPLPRPPQPLTQHFGDLVYRLAVHYGRSSGGRGLPDPSLYRTLPRDPLFSDLVFGEAGIVLATAPLDLAAGWAEVHRQMITEWGQSGVITELLQLFDKVQGTERAIKAGLARAMESR